MNKSSFITQDNELLYKKILFERPISKLHAKNIGLLIGKNAPLSVASEMYAIIQALSHNSVVVADDKLKYFGMPADVFLKPQKTLGVYANTDDAIEIFADCSYVVVGLEIEMSSILQIFLEGLIMSRKFPIVFTDESLQLIRFAPHLLSDREDDIYILSEIAIERLAKYFKIPFVTSKVRTSLIVQAELLQAISSKLRAHIICQKDTQILYSHYSDPRHTGVVNFRNPQQKRINAKYISILTSLLCDCPNPNVDFMQRVLTAGYLLRTCLNSSDDCVVALKNEIAKFN